MCITDRTENNYGIHLSETVEQERRTKQFTGLGYNHVGGRQPAAAVRSRDGGGQHAGMFKRSWRVLACWGRA